MWKIHWTAMQRVIELGYADRVFARYNSNMSRIDFYGKNLFDDCLVNFQDWQINASIDATGEIGEYIRTGLKYDEWLTNIKYARKFVKHPRQLQLDLTVTLPGLFDLENIELQIRSKRDEELTSFSMNLIKSKWIYGDLKKI